MSNTERATKVFFWIAFGAFLAMSVPHVAWVFRHYEPRNDGYGWAWEAISYGVAIGIDLLICWLSYTRSEQHSSKGDTFVVWAFIVLLAILSWYCNWIFAETMIGVNVWAILLFWGWTVGDLTPLIVSAIPMFLIAYTYMSKRILGAKPESAAELAQKNDEMAALLQEKARQNGLRNQHLSRGILGKIGVAKAVLSGLKSAQNLPETPAQAAGESEAESPVECADEDEPETARGATAGKKYLMTFAEAAEYTGYSISTLEKQLRAHEIEAGKDGKKLKVSTLKIKSGVTGKMPALSLVKEQEQSA